MAKTEGSIQGKVGNAVFYRVHGETRVRSVASRYADANTREQQEIRSRLRVALRFYQRMEEPCLREAWKRAAEGSALSGYNLFMKQNMLVFKPNGKIGDFSRLQLVEGTLQKVNHLVATVDENEVVSLNWEIERDLPSAREDDRLVAVVLYGNRSFTPVCMDTQGATRGEGKATLRLERKKGTAAHLYCFFREKEGKAYSGSQYLGI